MFVFLTVYLSVYLAMYLSPSVLIFLFTRSNMLLIICFQLARVVKSPILIDFAGQMNHRTAFSSETDADGCRRHQSAAAELPMPSHEVLMSHRLSCNGQRCSLPTLLTVFWGLLTAYVEWRGMHYFDWSDLSSNSSTARKIPEQWQETEQGALHQKPLSSLV